MLLNRLAQQLRQREAQASRRHLRVAESPCGDHQRFTRNGGPAAAHAQPLLTFGSNDYLELANHLAVVSALAEGAARYGAGSGASHLVRGHMRTHEILEARLAALLSPCVPAEKALVFLLRLYG